MREKNVSCRRQTKLDKINLMEKRGIPHNCFVLYKNLRNPLVWYKKLKGG